MMERAWIKTFLRIFLGLAIGAVLSADFLMVVLRFWESLITPYPVDGTEIRRTAIFCGYIGIYCATALIFGIVNSLFVPKEWHDMQAIVGSGLALIILLPFTFIEGYFIPAMLIFPLAVAAACGFCIKVGQVIVDRFRKVGA